MALRNLIRFFFPSADFTIYNSASKKKEKFRNHTNKVKMYSCGPTAHNYAHIGNLRSYVFSDLLRRTLEFNGFVVRHVINITDIGHLSSDADEGEDKITLALRRENKPLSRENMKKLSAFYTDRFVKDLEALNIKKPEHMPNASDYVPEYITFIKELERKKMLYKTSDGIYFNTSKFSRYGCLGGGMKTRHLGLSTESRIGLNKEKINYKDFAVWKFNPIFGYDAPWQKGFPGWHLECSAMAISILGDTIDIHTGGVDHIQVHHNNEIAQSETATGKKFVRYWMHNEFVTVEGAKMAKSSGNFITLESLRKNKITALAYRYWLLGSNYRTPIKVNWEILESAKTSFNRLIESYSELKTAVDEKPSQPYLKQFKAAINDDLNSAKALSLVWNILRDEEIDDGTKRATIKIFDKVLGLKIDELSRTSNFEEKKEIPKDVLELARQRESARKNKDWQHADVLRIEIEKRGYGIRDSEHGPKIFPK